MNQLIIKYRKSPSSMNFCYAERNYIMQEIFMRNYIKHYIFNQQLMILFIKLI